MPPLGIALLMATTGLAVAEARKPNILYIIATWTPFHETSEAGPGCIHFIHHARMRGGRR